jgi:hypothetical protein
MSLAPWLNTAWMCACAVELAAFRRATRCVAATQAALLRKLLSDNATAEFGARHGFLGVGSPRDYQQRVPLSTYADYAAAVERIGQGAAGVLTRQRIELLQPTSGTLGGEKLIPCTAGLRRQFQRGVAAWIADLFWHRPAVRRGRAYWSISPAFGPARHTGGGMRIGFATDAEYLGAVERRLLPCLLIAPASLARSPHIDSFRYHTLLCLLRAGDVALLSIWSPTFVTALFAPLRSWQDRLIHDLRQGTTLAGDERLPPDPRRADQVRSILQACANLGDATPALWPKLALISCWTDAAAGRFVPQVRTLFPGVEIQAKGLLATEGFVSLPLVNHAGAALAIRSHFFEFQEPGTGRCLLAHELDQGGRYGVVLTSAGGLYRYQLRDEVEVVGSVNQCPLLRFLGKMDRVCDLVGEKLAETHVRSVLDRLWSDFGLSPTFDLLAPATDRRGYRLFVQGLPNTVFAEVVSGLRQRLELGLMENPHYRHARRLEQLAAVEIALLDADGEPGSVAFLRRLRERGQQEGAIKPTCLDTESGWEEALACRAPSADKPAALPTTPATRRQPHQSDNVRGSARC